MKKNNHADKDIRKIDEMTGFRYVKTRLICLYMVLQWMHDHLASATWGTFPYN